MAAKPLLVSSVSAMRLSSVCSTERMTSHPATAKPTKTAARVPRATFHRMPRFMQVRRIRGVCIRAI
jgi:hypothetical protein